MTDRWWTDVSKAQQILAIVGGDDVAQSVGTVALGFHSVLANQLRPLANATLVDNQDVLESLAEVDLVPVTKAMAAAVSPVLGSAAPAYAADLVSQLHEDACESIRHELTTLNGKGVPWPLAIERVAGVAGVPVRAVNGYVQKMAAPQVNPRVLADEGDRTLMTWASRLGKREATPPLGEVDKAQGQWEAEEHPRSGETGRFVSDTGEGEQRTDRLGRLSRLTRLTRLQSQQQQAQAQRAAEEKARTEKKSLAQLQAEVLGRAGARQQGARRAGARTQGARQAGTRQAGARQEQAPQKKGKALEAYHHQLQDAITLDVEPRHMAFHHLNDIISATELNRHGDFSYEVDEQPPGAARMVIDRAYVSHENNDGSYELDPNFDYKIVDVGMGGIQGFDLVVHLEPVEKDRRVGKADWDEEEHPRDVEGRFAAGERAQRLNRLGRLQGLARRQAQQDAEHAQRLRDLEAQRAEQDATAAAVARMPAQGARQQGARQQGARQGGARQPGLRATGRHGQQAASGSEQESAWDENILAAHDRAVLVDDFIISQLTGHQVLDDELSAPLPMHSQDVSPTDLKRLMRRAHPVAAGDVTRVLATQAINHTSNHISPMYSSDVHYDSPEEALEESRLALMGNDLHEDMVFVPSVLEGHGPNNFRPGFAKQIPPEKQGTPRHPVVGSDMALHNLLQGNTANLTIRRVKEGLTAEELEAMGGGKTDTRYVRPYIDSAVFEVVEMRPGAKGRA